MKGTWDDDRDPLRALARGEAELFEQFCASEAGTFLAFFRRLGVGPAESEDLTQDVFLKLYQATTNYRSRERFGAYCMRVAKNAWVDWRRRRAVRGAGPRASEDDGLDPATLSQPATEEPLAGAIRREEGERARAGLDELSDGHRLVFELGVLQERPYAEIAELLDIPVGTVKSRMYHAVRRMRAVLEAPQGRTGTDGPAGPGSERT